MGREAGRRGQHAINSTVEQLNQGSGRLVPRACQVAAGNQEGFALWGHGARWLRPLGQGPQGLTHSGTTTGAGREGGRSERRTTPHKVALVPTTQAPCTVEPPAKGGGGRSPSPRTSGAGGRLVIGIVPAKIAAVAAGGGLA